MNPSTLQVLIVDDSPEDRYTLHRLLTHATTGQYLIREADRGDRALTACRAAPPDCVLLDYRLPDQDGLAVLTALRAFTDVAVVLLTGVGHEALAVEAFQRGAQDYVVKGSCTTEQLQLSIRRAVANVHVIRERDHALARLDALITGAPSGIAYLDRELRYVLINPTLAALNGWPPEAHLGRTLAEMVPSLAPWLEPFVRQVLATGAAMHDVALYGRPGPHSGEAEDWLLSFNPVHGPLGDIERVGVTVIDITPTKRTKVALSASEARYRAMFEQNAAIQLLLDPSDGAIVDANPAAVRFYGYPRETLLGMRISAINQLPAAEVLAALNASLRNDYTHFHRLHRLASGEIRAVEVFAGPVMIAERQLLYAIIHDESERVRAEEALAAERASLAERVAERTAELAAALRAKDAFLANMSHELRTPLNAILGRAELLRVGIHGPLNAQQDQDLAAIDEAGQHLLALINDVLDLAKIEAGRLTLESGPLQVTDLCQAALRMVAQAAVQQQLRLHTTIDPQLALIDADARRLKQILVNLLANAVKFTPPGGEVGLEVRGDAERQTVTFTVWDTGIGIAPEDQARLFQPFEQGSSGLSRQYGGTGLGLAVVLRLVELHGGSVTLESSPGAGSRFRVTLPWVSLAQPPPIDAQIDRAAAALARADSGSMIARTQPLILLADDNAANVALLRDYLSTVGYRVVVAHDGMEAVTHALDVRPALILMDIQMPVLDGLEAIRQIRAAGMATTPIIALTALAMPGDRERCLATGANAYLARPVSLRTLLATIAAHLQPRGEAHGDPQRGAT